MVSTPYEASPAPPTDSTRAAPLGFRRFLQLLLLALAAWAAMYCRSALGPLQEAIHAALDFSDNEMALLQGLAMALPMALGSIPLGLLADRINRARMLIFFVALTPLSCTICALASHFPSSSWAGVSRASLPPQSCSCPSRS